MRLPKVSIIMPIRNEASHIAKSLGSVLGQDYSVSRLEVLLADGMSDDNTRFIVRQMAGQNLHVSLIILDNPGRIVSTGLNIALREARGDVIVRVDGHTIIAPDYVRQCVDVLHLSGVENVGGRMNAVGDNLIGHAIAVATNSRFGVGGGRFHYSDSEERVDTVYMGAWPRRVFEEIGLFDEELVRDQDDEFNYRLRAAGGNILLSPRIMSEYYVRSNPFALGKQYFQYGMYKVRVLQKHPRQMRYRQFVPIAFVLALIASLLLSFSPSSRSVSSVVPALYVSVNLLASIIIAIRSGWKCMPLLMVTFAILHLSYGVGFLVGLAKFWNRWGDRVGKTPTLGRKIGG